METIKDIPWDSIHELDELNYKYIEDSKGYFITDQGKVFSATTGKWLKSFKDKDGYLLVNIYYNNGKMYTKKVHRLVAIYFIPNPNTYEVVNHKDEIKSNNVIKNLEWCTVAYNNAYGKRMDAFKVKIKHIYEYTIDGDYVKEFNSVDEIFEEYGFAKTSTRAVCIGNSKSIGSRLFRYYKADSIVGLTQREKNYSGRYTK